MAHVNAGGLRFFYEEFGDGPAVVLIHGGLVTGRGMWKEHIPALAEKYRVIVPDSRGHGGTDNPAGTLSYALMVDDYAALIAALGLRRPAVIGYSDGGQIALELAIRHPGAIGPFVAGGVATEPTRAYREAIEAIGFLAPDTVDVDRLQRAMPGLLDAIRRMHRFPSGEHERTFLRNTALLWHSLPTYRPESLSRISVPALVLVGDRDEMCSLEQALHLRRTIPGAELAVIPGAGHDVLVRERTLMLHLILGFLERNLERTAR